MAIRRATPALKKLSHGKEFVNLVFPLTRPRKYKNSERFTLEPAVNNPRKPLTFNFMLRMEVEEVVRRAERLGSGRHSTLCLHGVSGYGKSHILAAVSCHLQSKKDKHYVVYIPDCAAALREDALTVVKEAMLLTFPKAVPIWEQIFEATSIGELKSILQRCGTERKIFFVYDQFERFDRSISDVPELSAAKFRNAHDLVRLSANHLLIIGVGGTPDYYLKQGTIDFLPFKDGVDETHPSLAVCRLNADSFEEHSSRAE